MLVDSARRSLAEGRFAIVDVETTGVNPARDRVVEVACLVIDAGRTAAEYVALVDPKIPISRAAAAVHGLCDADVAGGPELGDLIPQLKLLTEGATIVAHNASFDRAFLPFLAQQKWLCTRRLAMHVFPDAPRFSNQGLREYLRIADPRLEGLRPHRALADVLVTCNVLSACLRRYEELGLSANIDAAIDLAKAPTKLRSLWFGRYRRAPIASIPDDYLRWVASIGHFGNHDVRFTAEHELARRRLSSLAV